MTARKLSKGLVACEEALQRLLDGRPNFPEHVSLDVSKITAGVVSYEAGFDRGYLKKSRKSHLPLLSRIEAIRAGSNGVGLSAGAQKVKFLLNKISALEKEISVICAQRDRVLTQNLQLWERVRDLERKTLNKSSSQVRRLHHV